MTNFIKSTTKSESAKTRNHGKKRCCRFSVSIQNDTDHKLQLLATSCGMTKSEMVDTILLTTLNSPTFIEQAQHHYNKNERFLIKPIVVNTGGRQQVIYN
ncbi:hypothetical protein [Thalassobacillus sp. C254]|uniref:hypothetical protein n=1 Tax=Thalassobacillus sp. C254 TaxID=1225341 RepID=UPI0006D12912|nr:hypothetical protein [Thalassobacillus sp. C254]